MSDPATHLERHPFGRLPDGSPVELYALRNPLMEVGVLTYGARIAVLRTPSRVGEMGDVVLGYEDLESYWRDTSYLGATVGRFANRIAKGRLPLDGEVFHLSTNEGTQTLHGGVRGFDKRLWRAAAEEGAVTMTYRSVAGEEGFPGALDVRVRFSVHGGELRIDYCALPDRTTVVNLTNHSYFNLTARPERSVLGHRLTIYADRFTPIDSNLIPTGERRLVEGTPLDFRSGHIIGSRIGETDEQLHLAHGYDHNWILRDGAEPTRLAAEVYEPLTGRNLEIFTSEPGLQFYSGNMLDGSAAGKGGIPLEFRCGLCLETQHFPDSPHHPQFPSTVVYTGQEFRSTTRYRFSAVAE